MNKGTANEDGKGLDSISPQEYLEVHLVMTGLEEWYKEWHKEWLKKKEIHENRASILKLTEE